MHGLVPARTESLESNRVIEVRARRFGCRDRNERPAVSWVSMKVAAGGDDAGYPLKLELAVELIRGYINARFWGTGGDRRRLAKIAAFEAEFGN